MTQVMQPNNHDGQECWQYHAVKHEENEECESRGCQCKPDDASVKRAMARSVKRQGVLAGIGNDPVTDNPFKNHPWLYRLWDQGWQEGQEWRAGPFDEEAYAQALEMDRKLGELDND